MSGRHLNLSDGDVLLRRQENDVSGSRIVYMDYNATTPLHSEVKQAMSEAMDDLWRNPSSSYAGSVRDSIREARRQVAYLMGADEDEIIFCSSGTEANNWILESVVNDAYAASHAASGSGSASLPHVLVSDIEHDAVSRKMDDLSRKGLCGWLQEFSVVLVVRRISASSDERIDVDDVLEHCRDDTCLVSVMLANNETGVIQPEDLGEALAMLNKGRAEKGKRRIYFHTDAAQAFGKIPVNVKKLGVDFLTVVGHKFYGPRCGAVYCRKDLLHLMKPIFFGGGQERNLRPGTENVVNIVGMGKAAEVARSNTARWRENFSATGQYFVDKLKFSFGDSCVFNFPARDLVLPNTFSIYFADPRCKGYRVLEFATRIEASTGAACHSGRLSASPVLLNSGIIRPAAENTIRISFGKDTSKEEIDILVADLAQSVKHLTQEHRNGQELGSGDV